MIKSLNIPKNVNTNLSIDNFIIIEIVGINNWGEIHKICEIETDQKFYSNNINKNIIIDTNIFIEQLQNQLNISDNPYIHKIEGIIENNDYIYNRALSKEKLVKLEKYYNRFLKRKERKN